MLSFFKKMKIRKSTQKDTKYILNSFCKLYRMHGYDFDMEELPKGIYFIAEDEGGAFGFLRAIMTKEAAHITDLFIEEEKRSKKLGSNFFNFFKSFAKSKGVRNLMVSIDVTNVGAERFWRKNGFHDYQIKLIQEIE